jgi:hypothetical protein
VTTTAHGSSHLRQGWRRVGRRRKTSTRTAARVFVFDWGGVVVYYVLILVGQVTSQPICFLFEAQQHNHGCPHLLIKRLVTIRQTTGRLGDQIELDALIEFKRLTRMINCD